MIIDNRTIRSLSLLAAVLIIVAVCWVVGCAKKSGREAVPEIPDTLTVTSDTLSKTYDTLPVTHDTLFEIPNTLTDKRDGKTYKTVTIGKQTWIAKNLNYATSRGSWCYGDNLSYCNTYGRLYDWNTAKTVCPGGWHLPTRQEWQTLVDFVDGFSVAGTRLKSTSGWNWNGYDDISGNGKGEYEFSALPGGGRDADGNYGFIGSYGSWLTATEYDGSDAYLRYMDSENGFMSEDYVNKNNASSVRCVKDTENDERLASPANGTIGDSEETGPWKRFSEMNSPAKKRKWLEERFPFVTKDTGYGGQASGKNTESYPDEINCVIDSAIPVFSQWEEFKYRPDSPIMDLLYFTSSPIRPISFRLFKLNGKSSNRACIWVEMWKMRSAADVREINTLIYDDNRGWEMYYGSYSPKSFFEFKEYFILVHGCSYVVDKRIFGVNKYIRKRCFDCGTIVGESPDRIDDKYSCYSDKVIFGQNDRDW